VILPALKFYFPLKIEKKKKSQWYEARAEIKVYFLLSSQRVFGFRPSREPLPQNGGFEDRNCEITGLTQKCCISSHVDTLLTVVSFFSLFLSLSLFFFSLSSHNWMPEWSLARKLTRARAEYLIACLWPVLVNNLFLPYLYNYFTKRELWNWWWGGGGECACEFFNDVCTLLISVITRE